MADCVNWSGTNKKAGGRICAPLMLFFVLVTSCLIAQPAGAAGTRLISHRQTLANATGPGTGRFVAGLDGHSQRPAISADGRFVVFSSFAGYFDSLEHSDFTDDMDSDIFLYDTQLDTTTRVSTGVGGVQADGGSFNPDISANGEWIVFESDATNIFGGDGNGERDIFRYHRPTGNLSLRSLNALGGQTSAASINASVADDGSVAFQSNDPEMTLVEDANGQTDVFARTAGNATVLVSVGRGGSSADGVSIKPEISGNGMSVTFLSSASPNELAGVPGGGGGYNLYRRTSSPVETRLVSVDIDDGPGDPVSASGHSVTQNGRYVAFASTASDLVAGLPDNRFRIFVRDMEASGPEKNMVLAQEPSADTVLRKPYISQNGEWVVYERDPTGADNTQILITPRTGGEARVASVAADGTEVADSSSINPVVSDVGSVAFESDSLKLKQNYLGRGLATWDELLCADVGIPTVCHDGISEHYVISLRETVAGSIEPGPYNPTPEVNEGEPLVKMERSSNGVGTVTDMTVTLKRPFNYHEFKDVEFQMPAGLVANTNVAKCTEAKANEVDPDNSPSLGCPDASRVGTVHADIELIDNLNDLDNGTLGLPYDWLDEGPDDGNPFTGEIPGKNGMDGEVYFGEPRPGEAGRLYAVMYDKDLLERPVVVPMSITTVPHENYRLRLRAEAIPNVIADARINQYRRSDGSITNVYRFSTVYPNIRRIVFTVSGSGTRTTNGHPFMVNPTFANTDIPAEQKGIEATIDNYGGSRNERFLPFSASGALGFAPNLNASLSTKNLGAKPVIRTEINQPRTETAMRSMRLSFKGFGLDLGAGLAGCSPADRDRGACPAASRIATVRAHSWLLQEPLVGNVYLAQGARSAFMTLNGLIRLDVDGDVVIDGREGSISLDISRGMPPFSGSRIEATLDSGLFKNPSKCGQTAEISMDVRSFTGQRHSDRERFEYCSVPPSPAASLKVKLKPNKAGSYTNASFSFIQASSGEAKKLRSLEIGLGKGKRAVKLLAKALKRGGGRSSRARAIGTLSLYVKGQRAPIKAKLNVRRKRIYTAPSGKRLKGISRILKRATKVRLAKGKIHIRGLPQNVVYNRVNLTLKGKKSRLLQNPKRRGKVAFSAKAITNTGTSITAKTSVMVR